MALALPARPAPSASIPRIACCANRAGDALRLATAIAHVAPPGLVLDIGCGTGGVAIPLLAARRDLRVVGLEIDTRAAASATSLAQCAGLGRRLSVVAADALAAPLPLVAMAVMNPPMLPGEPGWLVSHGGRPRPFAHVIVERLAEVPGLTDIWVHLVDFWGVDEAFSEHVTLASVASANGFEIGYPHRGWRAVGPGSAIRDALPRLAHQFPRAPVRVGAELRTLREARPADLLHIRHTIARLHRPASLNGVLP